MVVLAPVEPREAVPRRDPTRPWPRAAAAAVAAVLGLVITGGGAGLAVRHLQKVGLSAAAVAGFVGVALGLLLLGVGTRVLWRSTRRRWRLLLVPAGLASLVFAYGAAFAVVASVMPPIPLGDGTPADRGFAFNEVTTTTSDGARLSAWWVPSRNGAAVVLLHGAGESRTATLPQAAVLARHGFGVLMVDARGHGRSTGRGMDLGWYGDRDVRAAVDYVVRRPGVDPARVGLLGLSMGGEEAIGAAAADARVRAVVAEGATARTAADKAAWLPGGVNGFLQRGIDRLVYAGVDLLTPAAPPTGLRDAVRRARQTPFLLVAAGTMPDEERAARAFAAVAPERVQVWVVPRARHTHALTAQPGQWETRVVSFLAASLGVR